MNDAKMTKTQKGKMARSIVRHCLVMLTVAALWAMILETVASAYHVDIDLSDTLTFIGGVFGGELLLTLLKRIFAKPKEEMNND